MKRDDEMNKKYIFLDLDGTIIDHKTNEASSSTVEAIRLLKENGHEVFIATGRPPCLFFGIDKKLNIDSYVAANGRLAVYNNEIVFNDPLDKDVVKEFTTTMGNLGFDVGFETIDDYFVESKNTVNVDLFSDVFHLYYPEIKKGKYKGEDIYQMILYIERKDLDKAKKACNKVHYSVSNKYGVDVNEKSGLKDIGIKAIVEHLDISIEDCIAVGDGYNDISMIDYVGYGIAMGNANNELKEKADYVTDDISDDGLYKAFKHIRLI